ncbi:MAG: type II secretion system major pseudopilin GspG [Candidatus Xenobiia bacterium LiM19]
MKGKYAVARGFTFLEILVVVAILMILAGLIIPRYRIGMGIGEIGEDGKPYEGRLGWAKIQMTEMGKALQLYKLDSHHFPTTEQGLLALVEEPSSAPRPGKWKQYLDRLPVDPWKESFIYRCPRIRYEKYAGGYLRISRETCDPSPLSEMKSRSLARYRITDEELYSTYSLTCKGADGTEGTQDDKTIDEVNYHLE